MVLAPAIRGLFGIDVDATHRTLHLEPHLPASWDFAELHNVRVGDDLYEVAYKRDHDHLLATVRSAQPTVLCLNPQRDPHEQLSPNDTCHEHPATERTISLPLHAVEVSLPEQALPEAGSSTSQPRIIDESYLAGELSLTIEGIAGTTVDLSLRRNTSIASAKKAADISVEGAERMGDKLRVSFPPGSGFVSKQIHLSLSR
jgi:hypothetical protein